MAEGHDHNQTGAAQDAQAGPAQRTDARAVRARSTIPGLLRPEQLAARQAQIGVDRKAGGPSLDEEPGAGSVPSDVPATECEEPEA